MDYQQVTIVLEVKTDNEAQAKLWAEEFLTRAVSEYRLDYNIGEFEIK